MGNLEVICDLVDVYDAVKALHLLEEKGDVGKAYNLCTGKGVSLQEILSRMIKIAKSNIKIQVEPSKLRRGENEKIVGNPDRLFDLGWRPAHSLDETLISILTYWEQHA